MNMKPQSLTMTTQDARAYVAMQVAGEIDHILNTHPEWIGTDYRNPDGTHELNEPSQRRVLKALCALRDRLRKAAAEVRT